MGGGCDTVIGVYFPEATFQEVGFGSLLAFGVAALMALLLVGVLMLAWHAHYRRGVPWSKAMAPVVAPALVLALGGMFYLGFE